jgi:hypothetical protein
VGTSSDCWVFTGHERIEAGPMREECLVGQPWLVEPAAIQDLIDVSNKWNRAAGEAHELREEIKRLRTSSS